MSGKLIQAGLDWHSRTFMAGDIDALLPRYSEVLPVFLENQMVLIEGHDALRTEINAHRDHILAQGVNALRGVFTGGERVEVGKYNFRALWRYSFADGRPPRTASAIYFCLRNGDRTVVEMIEYRRLAFEQAVHWHNVLPGVPQTHVAQTAYMH